MAAKGWAGILLAACITVPAYADTVLLKNGRQIEGVVQREDEQEVCLEVQSGSVTFRRNEVEKVTRADAFIHNQMRQQWEDNKADLENRLRASSKQQESKPKEVEFSQAGNAVMVNARLNNRSDVRMILDTGASIILLPRLIARELGFDIDQMKPNMQVQVADGRVVMARHVVLDSVKVQGAEANGVDAAILMDEWDARLGEGLLGMSFLKNFKFNIDYQNKKLVLEKH